MPSAGRRATESDTVTALVLGFDSCRPDGNSRRNVSRAARTTCDGGAGRCRVVSTVPTLRRPHGDIHRLAAGQHDVLQGSFVRRLPYGSRTSYAPVRLVDLGSGNVGMEKLTFVAPGTDGRNIT